jgi:hypothetical protein
MWNLNATVMAMVAKIGRPKAEARLMQAVKEADHKLGMAEAATALLEAKRKKA